MMNSVRVLGTGSSGCVLSQCETYRYHLWREVRPEYTGRVCFVMLNPSTADHKVNDATIRKCLGFAERLQFRFIDVVNLFAWRARDPKALLRADDPIGPENDRFTASVCKDASLVIAAWGAHRAAKDRAVSFLQDHGNVKMYCLGITQRDGDPRHPLMLPYDTQLEPFAH